MGEETDGSHGVATLQGGGDISADSVEDGPHAPGPTSDAEPPSDRRPSDFDVGRRRFTSAALIAIALTSVPFIWILWGPWESSNPIRKTAFEDNFYDLQARAMFHGHLWLANGAVGIEAFIHAGRQYTYFGLFPSLIRMPILLFTSRLDGKLTAPFILASWLLTGLFASLLLWRVRILVRGEAPVGRTEAASFGVLMATIMGGSVFILLAATPYVFAEDLSWSICLTVGSIFALLGVLERPSWGRVIASGVLLLAANQDRVTTGWATVIAAVLIAGWFGFGRGGNENRRWCVPVLGAGLVPLLAGSAVNYAKFGVPFGVSNFDQVFTSVNAYRRQFLAANHNSEAGTAFIPSTILAYLRPDGLRITSVFPFITLPAAPPTALSGVLFDRRYRTASLPASMPLLFLLSCWGLVTAFRPKPVGRVALTRFLLVAALIAGGALLVWGYIAPRYLADFVPFLVLAAAVAVADIWRRLEGRSRSARVGVSAVIAAVALFSIAANIGIAITPSEEFNTTQVLHYVEAQKTISDVTGHPLTSRVVRGSSLPPWGPADQLYVIGNCDGLYISNGEYYSTVPSQQFQRTTWMAVERGHAFQHTFRITFNTPASGSTETLPLVVAGSTTVSVSTEPADHGLVQVRFGLRGSGRPTHSFLTEVSSGSSQQVVVITDPAKNLVQVTMGGITYLSSPLVDGAPIAVVSGQANGTSTAMSAVDETASSPEPSLCQSLIR
jgi:hypothetical protein